MSQGLFLVRMDVAHDHEATFNEVYDTEHVPNLAKVPGVQRASRFKQPSPTEPRYLAAYELDSPDVVASAAFKTAGELGRWPTAVRPHTMNRHLAIYEWVGGAKALTGNTKYLFWVMMDIEPHREALFNELYDNEHLPLLMKLPGSVNAVRYRTKRGRAAVSLRVRGGEHRAADVEALERHLGHRALEARGAAVHLQQALHCQRADQLVL